MVLDHVQSGRLLTEVLDHHHGATAHLARLALLVDLAQAGPLAQLLVGVDADQRDLVLVAQGGDQLLVLRLVAALGQDGEHRLASGVVGTRNDVSKWIFSTSHQPSRMNLLVQSLAGLVDAVDETVGDQGLLQHLLQGGVHVHRSTDHGGGDGHITGEKKWLVRTLSKFKGRRGGGRVCVP